MRVRAKANFRDLITDGRWHRGIVPGGQYLVLDVSEESFRIWDNDGDPILYPKELFDVTDARIPSGWVFVEYEDGEYHLEPELTSRPGFFEDYFFSDGDAIARTEARLALLAVLKEMQESLGGDDDRALVAAAITTLTALVPPSLPS